ncbi:MAG: hypothetical protein HXY18_19805 [Bryobacteraceae bacterium]|nr:hypothetical protein [Bryobacteraceae bacterium]
MTQSKWIAVWSLSLSVFWAGREAQAQSRTDLIQAERIAKEANLTPWVKPKAQRVIEDVQNSVPTG